MPAIDVVGEAMRGLLRVLVGMIFLPLFTVFALGYLFFRWLTRRGWLTDWPDEWKGGDS